MNRETPANPGEFVRDKGLDFIGLDQWGLVYRPVSTICLSVLLHVVPEQVLDEVHAFLTAYQAYQA